MMGQSREKRASGQDIANITTSDLIHNLKDCDFPYCTTPVSFLHSGWRFFLLRNVVGLAALRWCELLILLRGGIQQGR